MQHVILMICDFLFCSYGNLLSWFQSRIHNATFKQRCIIVFYIFLHVKCKLSINTSDGLTKPLYSLYMIPSGHSIPKTRQNSVYIDAQRYLNM